MLDCWPRRPGLCSGQTTADISWDLCAPVHWITDTTCYHYFRREIKKQTIDEHEELPSRLRDISYQTNSSPAWNLLCSSQLFPSPVSWSLCQVRNQKVSQFSSRRWYELCQTIWFIEKSVSKRRGNKNTHTKTKLLTPLNEANVLVCLAKGGKDLEYGWLARANHENGTKSAECDPDYGWLEGAEGSNKCYMLIKGFDSS